MGQRCGHDIHLAAIITTEVVATMAVFIHSNQEEISDEPTYSRVDFCLQKVVNCQELLDSY